MCVGDLDRHMSLHAEDPEEAAPMICVYLEAIGKQQNMKNRGYEKKVCALKIQNIVFAPLQNKQGV